MTEPDGQLVEGIFMLDECELAVRMVEAVLKAPRPAGATAEQAFDCLDEDMAMAVSRAAHAAVMYFTEQISASEITHRSPAGLQ